MKKIIIIMLCVLLTGVAIAVSVDQILTQDNVDAMNISTFDLQEQFVRDGSNKVNYSCENKICSVWATMISADKEMGIREVFDNETNETINESYWTGDYIVVDRVREIKFRKQPWADMRDETNDTYARQNLGKWLQSKRGRLVAEERTYLEGIQTQEEVDLSNILDNLE